MKKLLAMVVCLVMCLSFVACSGKEEGPVNSVVPPDEKTTGSVSIEIISAKLVKDTQDKDAVVVEYKFKNETQKDLAFKFSTKVTIKQGAETLKNAIVTPSDTFDSGTATKYAKPKEEVKVQVAYSVVDTKTPLDITVKPSQGENKTEVTKQLPLA